MAVDTTVLATELGTLFSCLLAVATAVVALINSFRTHQILTQITLGAAPTSRAQLREAADLET
jgi:hypothetical protein